MTAVAARPTHSEPTPPLRAVPGLDGLCERFRQSAESRVGRRFGGLRIEVAGGGGIVLHGVADSFYAKLMAQHVAASLTGLPVLANHIRVSAARTESGGR